MKRSFSIFPSIGCLFVALFGILCGMECQAVAAAANFTSVVPPSATSLNVIVPNTVLQIGATQPVTVIASFEDGSTQDVSDSANLTTTQPLIAGLNGTLMTALAAGAAPIRATWVDALQNTVSGTITVAVTFPAILGIGSNYAECMAAVGDPTYCNAMFPPTPLIGSPPGVIILAGPGGTAFTSTDITNAKTAFTRIVGQTNVIQLGDGSALSTVSLQDIQNAAATLAPNVSRLVVFIEAHGHMDSGNHQTELTAGNWTNSADVFSSLELGDTGTPNPVPIEILSTSCNGGGGANDAITALSATGGHVAFMGDQDTSPTNSDIQRMIMWFLNDNRTSPADLTARYLLHMYLTQGLQNRFFPMYVTITPTSGSSVNLNTLFVNQLGQAFADPTVSAAKNALGNFLDANQIQSLANDVATDTNDLAIPYGGHLAVTLEQRCPF